MSMEERKRIWRELSTLFGSTIRLEGWSSSINNQVHIDILWLDEYLDKIDPDYNAEECTYKEHEDISMGKYIELKYGLDVYEKVKQLI